MDGPRHVVGDEVQDQAKAATPEPLAKARQPQRLRRSRVDPIVAHREAGGPVTSSSRKSGRTRCTPRSIPASTGDAPGGLARLPDAEEPDEVEAVGGDPIQLSVGTSSAWPAGPASRASSESLTRVLTWKSDGYRIFDITPPLPTHLLADQPGREFALSRAEERPGSIRRRGREAGDQACPPGLVAGTEAGPLSPWKYS